MCPRGIVCHCAFGLHLRCHLLYDRIVFVIVESMAGFMNYRRQKMKRIEKRIAGIIIALVLVLAGVLECASVVKTAKADNSGLYYDLDDEGNVTEHYIGTETFEIYQISSTNLPTKWTDTDGIVYVMGYDLNSDETEDTINGRVTVDGDVKLIILDGYTLNVTDGIHVSEGNSLTICGPGTLKCSVDVPDYAAIGGSGWYEFGSGIVPGNAGTITIVGAKVEANGCDYAAAIGGGYYGSGGVITIADSTVIATGGYSGAGIGSGLGGKGGIIRISGGSVTASGGGRGAGIGCSDKGSIDEITIENSTIYATGGYNGAGIGGSEQGAVGTITISGGTVTATGGDCAAGIGGGYHQNGGKITISKGTIIANGGSCGAGIGDGADADGGQIVISGGKITANAISRASGIGGGSEGAGGTITISGGEITAIGGKKAAGIGGGEYAEGGMITISGGTVDATGGSDPQEDNEAGGAGIGGGTTKDGGVIIITGGTALQLQVKALQVSVVVTAVPVGKSQSMEGLFLHKATSVQASAAVTAAKAERSLS